MVCFCPPDHSKKFAGQHVCQDFLCVWVSEGILLVPRGNSYPAPLKLSLQAWWLQNLELFAEVRLETTVLPEQILVTSALLTDKTTRWLRILAMPWCHFLKTNFGELPNLAVSPNQVGFFCNLTLAWWSLRSYWVSFYPSQPDLGPSNSGCAVVCRGMTHVNLIKGSVGSNGNINSYLSRFRRYPHDRAWFSL